MTFGKSISTCFSKYATFSGRASRSEYWWWQLFVFIVAFAIVFTVTLIFGEDVGTIVERVIQIALLLPNLAVAVRRCHDSNHNGWWILCPIYNLVLMFVPSTEGANDYGESE